MGVTTVERSCYAIHTTVEYTNALVPDMVSISNAPYYWGRMDRYEAERLLDGRPEGTFLLRDSAQINYLFSISFRRYQRTLHARIEHLDGMFRCALTTENFRALNSENNSISFR